MIYAIILAAGESKRMGQPKMLLPFGDRTIIETVVDCATRSMVDGVIVVVGANGEKVTEAVGERPVQVAMNPNYREGMLSSIRWGINALPPQARAALVMLGDQPLIASSTIDKVIAAYHKESKGLVLPVYGGKRGHPLLIDTKYQDELAQLDGAIGLRAIIHNNSEDVLEVEMDDAGILHDIDTAEEYQEMIKQRRGQ